MVLALILTAKSIASTSNLNALAANNTLLSTLIIVYVSQQNLISVPRANISVTQHSTASKLEATAYSRKITPVYGVSLDISYTINFVIH